MGLATETVEGESEWGVIGPIGHKGPINYREPNLSALAFTKSNMPTLQYRERSDRMAQSTLRLNSDGWFVECATAALRSRYCTARSTLTKIRVFVQSRLLYRSNPSGNSGRGVVPSKNQLAPTFNRCCQVGRREV